MQFAQTERNSFVQAYKGGGRQGSERRERPMQGEEKPESSYKPFEVKEKIGEMMRYGRPLTMQFR